MTAHRSVASYVGGVYILHITIIPTITICHIIYIEAFLRTLCSVSPLFRFRLNGNDIIIIFLIYS